MCSFSLSLFSYVVYIFRSFVRSASVEFLVALIGCFAFGRFCFFFLVFLQAVFLDWICTTDVKRVVLFVC